MCASAPRHAAKRACAVRVCAKSSSPKVCFRSDAVAGARVEVEGIVDACAKELKTDAEVVLPVAHRGAVVGSPNHSLSWRLLW